MFFFFTIAETAAVGQRSVDFIEKVRRVLLRFHSLTKELNIKKVFSNYL